MKKLQSSSATPQVIPEGYLSHEESYKRGRERLIALFAAEEAQALKKREKHLVAA